MLDSDRKWAISCYIPIANIVFCLLASVRCVKSHFCLFHARQGLILFGTWLITLIFSAISRELGLMVWGVVVLMHGTGIYYSYHGKEFSIPGIGPFVKKIPEYYLYEKLTGKKPESDDASTNPSSVVKSKNVDQAVPQGQAGESSVNHVDVQKADVQESENTNNQN